MKYMLTYEPPVCEVCGGAVTHKLCNWEEDDRYLCEEHTREAAKELGIEMP